MTEIERELLTEQIGIWCGFVRGKDFRWFGNCHTNDWWITPAKHRYRGAYKHLPYFLNSFDSHISWTISKAMEDFGKDSILADLFGIMTRHKPDEWAMQWSLVLIKYINPISRMGK